MHNAHMKKNACNGRGNGRLGGSVGDPEVIAAADQYGMTMAFSGVRLFHH